MGIDNPMANDLNRPQPQPEEPKALTGRIIVSVDVAKTILLRECHKVTDPHKVRAWAEAEAARQMRNTNWSVEMEDVNALEIELDE